MAQFSPKLFDFSHTLDDILENTISSETTWESKGSFGIRKKSSRKNLTSGSFEVEVRIFFTLSEPVFPKAVRLSFLLGNYVTLDLLKRPVKDALLRG